MFVKFGSHRARQYGLRALDRKPQAYYSFARKTGPGGVYKVTIAEAERMRASSVHAKFTVLRGPYEDLQECFSS